jgi:hypothetical protein
LIAKHNIHLHLSDYIYQLYDGNIFDQYKRLIMNLANNLNSGGSIICAYIYGISENNTTFSLYNNKTNREKLLINPSFSTLYFDSVNDMCDRDAVMVYTKRK